MRKRRNVLIGVAGLAAAVALIAFFARDTEPHYGGRSLSEWLRPAPGQRPSRELSPEAQTAIRHIGTNALPTVLRWISYEPSLGRTKFRQYLGFLLPKADPGDRRADDAVRVFATLGCQAAPAIPELARLAETSTRGTWRGRRCVDALYCIGPESFPALLTMITNTECRFRLYATAGTRRLGTNMSLAVPLLLRLLDDQDERVACAAAENLSLLHSAPSNTVPALALMMQSTNSDRRLAAARGLRQFQAQARIAVPQLQRALADTSGAVRDEAVSALRVIAPEALTNAPAQ